VVILDPDDLVKILIQIVTMANQVVGFEFVESIMTCSVGSHVCEGSWGKFVVWLMMCISHQNMGSFSSNDYNNK